MWRKKWHEIFLQKQKYIYQFVGIYILVKIVNDM